MLRVSCLAVLLCLSEVSGYRADAADELKATATTVTGRNYPRSGERLAGSLNTAPCFSGSSEFVASWQGREFLAPCRFIHETIAHLRAASTMKRTGPGFPLNTDHVHLAVPADLWETKYRRLPKDQILSALLGEPNLVAVYHATDALTRAESEKAEGAPGPRRTYNNRQVLGHYNGRGVEILPNHANALADRYRSVAWFYFMPRQPNGLTVSSRGETGTFDISFDHYLASECSSSDHTEDGIVRIKANEKDRVQDCDELSFKTVAETGVGLADQQKLGSREERGLDIDTESLDRMEKIADAYRRRGLYSHAEEIIQDIFQIRQKKKGPEDAEMAYYHNSLGWLQAEQGKYGQAEQRYLRAVAITEKHWGPNHPDVADLLNNLAGVHRSQARFAEAEALYQRSIAIWQKYSGSDHPNMALTLNNLGGLYALQGRLILAEALFQRVLRIQEAALGIENPEIATAVNNLAWVYNKQGKFPHAEALYKRVIEIWTDAYGPEHPDVALGLNNLGTVYRGLGHTERAEDLYLQSLAIRQRILGRDHPDVGTTLKNLAELYRDTGRNDKAEPLYRHALVIMEKTLGEDHPEVVEIRASSARTPRVQKSINENVIKAR